MKPDVRITWNDGFALAYQVVGTGDQDVVYLPGFVSNVDLMWDVPPYARFLERLASMGRLIPIDRRGVGCSDRLAPGTAPTLEELADDVLAVLEAVSSPGATIFAVQDAAFPAMLLAASHPYDVQRLVLFGGSPSWVRSEELPDEWPEERWESQLRSLERLTSATEGIQGYLRAEAPSLMGDERSERAFVSLYVNNQGLGASLVENRMFSHLDIRAILPSIVAPTLVIRRERDDQVAESSARYLADHVQQGRYVELPGREPLPWLGDTGPLFDELERFMGVAPATEVSDRRLATVLFTDIVGSTERQAALGDLGWKELVQRHHEIVRAGLRRWNGVERDTAGDGFYATFDGPARAIRSALEIVEDVRQLGIEIRAGVHTGECEMVDGKFAGLAISIGARVAASAGPSQVWISRTVRDLIVGSDLTIEDVGDRELKGVPGTWRLYRVTGG